MFGNAFHQAFTVPTILAAFEKTGIHPYNPDVITPRMMKASEPSSLIGSLPIPMPSPVRAIMVAFNAHGYTATDLDPDNFRAQPTTPSHIPQPIASGSVLPASLSSAYYTPSSRMRMMTSALASTASGSFRARLVPDTPATMSLQQSHAHILARNSVIEGANAQLAVQSIVPNFSFQVEGPAS